MSYHSLELFRGPAGRAAPVVVKQCLRLARRLRTRGIAATMPYIVDDAVGASILVGARVVNVSAEGDITPQIKPAFVGSAWRFDRQAIVVWRQRSHARWLSWAANARVIGMYEMGRINVDCARMDRLYWGGF